jgi:hypothetical protein
LCEAPLGPFRQTTPDPFFPEGIEAEVRSRTYLGELEQMALAAGGVELRATVLNPGLVAQKADRVRVRFDPADVLAFAEVR